MITKTYPVTFHPGDTVFRGCEERHLLFFDIETTGLSARSSSLYLIGAVSLREGGWTATQWFAETPMEEGEILRAFLSFAAGFTQLVHFNGDRFDLPYLADKCRAFGLPDTLSALLSRDIYRMARPLKALLSLQSLKQKSLEAFLGISREDRCSGGELINVYHDYVMHPREDTLQLLLLHNYEDLLGMLAILPILSYRALTDGFWQADGCRIDGDTAVFHAALPCALPLPLTRSSGLFSLSAGGRAFTLRVPGVRRPLKYFFPDYKNYCYLPLEDTAIHKSVAAYVDREHREPAKPSNCYCWKDGFYLPQDAPVFSPVFREDYQSTPLYFACTDSFLADRETWQTYLLHLVGKLATK